MKFFKAISKFIVLALLLGFATMAVSLLSPTPALALSLSFVHFAVLFPFIIVAAGRKVVTSGTGGILLACFAGPVIVFIDTVIVNGIGGLLQPEYQRQLAAIDPARATEARAIWMALITTTFLAFFPIAMAFSALGGWFGRRALRKEQNAF